MPAAAVTDLSAIAPGLERRDDGVWQARTRSAVQYPDDGNAFCFAVEDGSFWFQHRNGVILDAVRRHPPAGAIADIGAGNGYVSLGLQRAGIETLVIEPGPVGIANARTRGVAPLVWATLEDAGFLPGRLPAAGLFDVLEHIPDDRGTLAHLRTLLVDGGRVYLTVPAYQWLWSPEDDAGGHQRRYTRGGLVRLLASCGFHVDTATYFFAPLPLPILLARTIPSRLGLAGPVDAERAGAQLQPSGLLVDAMIRTLAMERRWLESGRTIPAGASVLAVARRA